MDISITCQSGAEQYLTDLGQVCNDPCHTTHSSNPHKMDEHPMMKMSSITISKPLTIKGLKRKLASSLGNS